MRPATMRMRVTGGREQPSSAKMTPFSKENREALSERKQKCGRDIFGVRVMSEPRVRVRQAFLAVNLKQEGGIHMQQAEVQPAKSSHTSPLSADEGTTAAMTKEDIEALLGLKMKGKNKFDFKGKSEQMMEYIKKLRSCICWLQESEAACIVHKQLLQAQLLDERNSHTHTESLLRARQGQLEEELSELKIADRALQDKLCESTAREESLSLQCIENANALQTATKEIGQLTQESHNLQKELDSVTEQVTSLQDINKKLQEYNSSLQHYNSKLQSDMATTTETLSKIQKEKAETVETLSNLRGHAIALQEQLSDAKVLLQESADTRKLLLDEGEKLRSELQEALADNKRYVACCESFASENAKQNEFIEKSSMELGHLRNKATALEENCASQSERIESLSEQLELTQQRLKVTDVLLVQYKHEGAEQSVALTDLQKKLSEAEVRMREGDLLRRKLHNTILELKGNIRVFCRVRPFVPDDEGFGEEQPPVLQYPCSTELLGRGIEIFPSQGQKYTFSFDKVFWPEAGQEDVFVEISQLIQSALDGYKVCIFAYGQTGSGKTYTMLGNLDDPLQKGVIPRSLEQIFRSSQDLSSQGWNFQMQVSMLEIYNETIRDLLAPQNTRADMQLKQHTVKHDQNGSTIVSDLTVVEVRKWWEVSVLLERAAQTRAVEKTTMNEQSSRSHCVFTLCISGFNEIMDQQVQGVLNLIDLAGSERLSRTGSSGDRLKETQAINKSLATLGDVILAIANREQHVPYRNSKLTYLLQPCLGGDSKTLMFVNISPDAKSANESLCSLRFGAKVNACQIGIPRRTLFSYS